MSEWVVISGSPGLKKPGHRNRDDQNGLNGFCTDKYTQNLRII